ncbi:MAG TPA: TerC family protein [Polyangia bacterium]|nr:TerC family protein [Polyangia bacterium]
MTTALASVAGPVGWIVFATVVVVMLALDLGVFNRRPHTPTTREAALWSLMWISISLAFNGFVFARYGGDRALEFFQAWLIEKALSVDNLFVFLAAFSYFAVPPQLQHRVLFWGILGALLTRGAFIAVGAELLATFHWVMYAFGAILVLTAVRLVFGGDDDPHPERNPVLGVFRKLFRVTPDYVDAHFFVKRDGLRYATPLLMVLVVIEASDVVFAVDSIPAVFGITRDVFIVYTSNIFAVFGLRALCFLVANIMRRLHYLKPALAGILAFVGVKMIIADYFSISDVASLGVVGGILAIATIASLIASPAKSDIAEHQ